MFWSFSVCGCTCRGAQYKFPSLWSLSTESIHAIYAALPLFLAGVGVGESIIQWESERIARIKREKRCIRESTGKKWETARRFLPFTAILTFVYRSLQQQEYKQLNMKIITLYSHSREQLWNDVEIAWLMWSGLFEVAETTVSMAYQVCEYLESRTKFVHHSTHEIKYDHPQSHQSKWHESPISPLDMCFPPVLPFGVAAVYLFIRCTRDVLSSFLNAGGRILRLVRKEAEQENRGN